MANWTVLLLDIETHVLYETGVKLRKREAVHVSENWPVDELSTLPIPCSKSHAEILTSDHDPSLIPKLVSRLLSRAGEIEFAASHLAALAPPSVALDPSPQ